MANNFLKQLNKEETDYISRKQKQAIRPKTAIISDEKLEKFPNIAKTLATPSPIKKSKKFHTMKASQEAYEKFDILQKATGLTFSELLNQASEMLFEAKSIENERVKAMAALLHDYPKEDKEQMSIEDFL
ncbi:hypothetical protein [Lactococcus garvieae]|uniref:Uncharacterized protein n=1 Tax=Lactococcus garvieae TaxID=1363 RepID=A0A1I4GFS5_9LACT|nr:hypothetical protein [Lactococcus garvieae]SFL28922.1 hypothetical protein SAMN05216438_10413 [Lactococcus garvieae]